MNKRIRRKRLKLLFRSFKTFRELNPMITRWNLFGVTKDMMFIGKLYFRPKNRGVIYE